MTKKADLEEMFPPTRLILRDNQLFYVSPTRGEIRVNAVKIIPNYGDVEIVLCFNGAEVHAITRTIGSDYGQGSIEKSERHVIYSPRGDVVIFNLEDGRTIHMDLGADPGGHLRKLVSRVMSVYRRVKK